MGPNEAGKSTLFEALSRGVFDRYTSRSGEIRLIQPLGSSLGPEVSLIWRSAAGRLRIFKQFLHEPVAELHRERDGVFELDHEGDRADREIRRLFDAAEPRGTAKPQHRGLAQALWFLGRDEPLPQSEWDRSVRGGLEAVAHRGLLQVGERRLEEAIERAYATHYTP